MKSMNFIYSAIAVCRNYTTKRTGTSSRRVQSSFKNKLTNPTKPSSKIKWTDQQSQVLAAISNKQSVFITGSAGTGKTALIKHLIKLLKSMYGRSEVFVTASTGVAACDLRGQTLHSFAGIGLGAADRETLLLRVLSNKRAYKRWKKVKALVIDEISMVDADLFENLSYIARETRGNSKDKVWGGIQLVVGGDFFQLPPVLNSPFSSGKEFAFEADCWKSSFDLEIELTKIFRQSESQLIKVLQGIRRGQSDPEDLEILKQCFSHSEPDPAVIRIYPRNEDVERVNKVRLGGLGKEKISYTAVDTGKDPWKKQLKLGIAADELDICIGARVMLTKNTNPRLALVNGATGTIVDFVDDTDVIDICDSGLLPKVNFDSGHEVVVHPNTWEVMEGDIVFARRKQIPLILAWALSIHKCQGMTLDSLHTDLCRAFGCGMVYVALSRVRTLGGLHLSGFKPSKIRAHPKVLQFYQRFSHEHNEGSDVRDEYGVKSRSSRLNDVVDKKSEVGIKNQLTSLKFEFSCPRKS